MRKTTEEFVKEAQLLNPNYDYSQVSYTTSKDKVKIICDKGHLFTQTPNHHLRGEKCPYCANNIQLTTDDFIKRANQVHNNKYDYSLVEYKTSKDNIKIICPKHGIFTQNAGNHLSGFGCKKCGRDTLKKTSEELVKQLKNLYGDYYDYSLVEYSGRENKIKIICPKHNIQTINPRNALKGNVCCKECYYEKTRLAQEEFIKKSNYIHNNEFDYSLVEYKNATTPVIIKCKKGHTFKMKPQMHLYSCCGCPICIREKRSKGERQIKWFLTQNNIEFEEQKSFKNCKNKNLLLFDFYLPRYNLCIEYQGIQHYKNTGWFGGGEEFKNRQIRDNIKKDFCKNNNVNLLEIKYNESISKTLNEYFIKRREI